MYKFAKEVATHLVGQDAVYDTPALMTGEDFAFIAEKVPSAYLFVGIRNETLGSVHELHTSEFMLDEQVRRLMERFDLNSYHYQFHCARHCK